MTRMAHNARWVIVSVNKPLMMRRSDDETWLLNPRRRYILNAELLTGFQDHIETMSDLNGSTHYRPVHLSTTRLPKSSLLIERYRDRGLGDLLFTTGPLAYLHHVTGGDIQNYLYAYAERGAVLNHCEYIADKSPLVGPVIYDELGLYDHHWFIDTVTDFSEERDQLNVYDALFKSLGIDPKHVDPRFKRPYAWLAPHEIRQLDDFYFWIFNQREHVDLRKSGYYVVAPFCTSSSRSAPYAFWLKLIEQLSSRRPVLIVGVMRERMPTTDMNPGDFVNIIDAQFVPVGRVVNLINKTQVRNLMQLISKANCVFSLDSASLYIAQAFRTPCVSLWGTHDPAVRLGYDLDYMDLAIWHQSDCLSSPCFAWQGFPKNRCPQGENQQICQCLSFIDPAEALKRLDTVEAKSPKTVTIATPKTP